METAGRIAEEVAEKFNQEWEPLMENVKEAAETFDDLQGRTTLAVLPSGISFTLQHFRPSTTLPSLKDNFF